MPRISFAVFDLDGTLIDSRRDLADSANAMLATYGAPALAEETVAAMVGCGAATLVARAVAASNIVAPLDEALQRFLSSYDQRLSRHTRPYDGIPRMLDDLSGTQTAMALLTNKPMAQSVRLLEIFGLAKYFRWIVGGDGPWPRKPSPDGMRHLMHQASAGPLETILVGDSAVDLITSRNAGVRICLARYGFGYADLPADDLRGDEALVDTPSEIAMVVHASR